MATSAFNFAAPSNAKKTPWGQAGQQATTMVTRNGVTSPATPGSFAAMGQKAFQPGAIQRRQPVAQMPTPAWAKPGTSIPAGWYPAPGNSGLLTTDPTNFYDTQKRLNGGGPVVQPVPAWRQRMGLPTQMNWMQAMDAYPWYRNMQENFENAKANGMKLW